LENAAFSKFWNRPAEKVPIPSDILAVARIAKEWGVKGEVKALPLSEKVFCLGRGSEVSLFRSEGALSTAKVTSIRRQGKHIIMALEGCCEALSASRLRDSFVCISRGSVVLEENEFFCDELIGIPVVTIGGKEMGKVAEILQTGSNDVYVVKSDEKEYLLPAIRDVIQEVDLPGQRIVVKDMPGIFD
jgi:16S rRNA processing protein RimM